MARLESLYCPFASKVHPDASAAHEASVVWARTMGMLPTEQHVRGAQNAKVGWLAARGFPTATRRGLQLVADWTLLFCMLDDHIERLDAAHAEAYLARLLGVLHSEPAIASDAFDAAMIDIRCRLQAQASAASIARFETAVAGLFDGFATEARDRERGRVPDVTSYLQLREVTVGLHVILTLVEAVEDLILPDHVIDHPVLRRLASRTSNIVGWSNDLFTYEKEIIQGEIHNLVLAIMTERKIPMAEAVAVTVELHDEEVCRFIQDIELLPSFGAADPAVRRYVEMLRCWVRGHLDWARETGRYQPGAAPTAPHRMVTTDDGPDLSPAPWPLAGIPRHVEAEDGRIAMRRSRARLDGHAYRERARGTEDVRPRVGLAGVVEDDRGSDPASEYRSESREIPRVRGDSDRVRIDLDPS